MTWLGQCASIDVLGEDVTDPEQAERATAAYLDLLAVRRLRGWVVGLRGC